MGRLPLPQAILASLGVSRTINVSFGDRPVYCPVRHASSPSAAMSPSWRRTASSYNAAVERFHLTRSDDNPSSSSPRPTSVLIQETPVPVHGILSHDGAAQLEADDL